MYWHKAWSLFPVKVKYLIKIGLQINPAIICQRSVCASKQDCCPYTIEWGRRKRWKSTYSSFRRSLLVRTRDFLHSLLRHSEKQEGGIRMFSINFSRTDSLQFRHRDAKTFFTKTQGPVRAANRRRIKTDGQTRLWAALRVPSVPVEQRDPAIGGDVKDSLTKRPRDASCSLSVPICIVLMFCQQTVTQRWQRRTLTNTSFHRRAQIVANLILTNVCLPFFWAGRERVLQTWRPCQRWHHAVFSTHMRSTAAGCRRRRHERREKKKSRKTPPPANMSTPCMRVPAWVPFHVCHGHVFPL